MSNHRINSAAKTNEERHWSAVIGRGYEVGGGEGVGGARYMNDQGVGGVFKRLVVAVWKKKE